MSDKLREFYVAATTNPMDTIQTVIERIILYSRYLLVVFYIGLAFALVIYAITFIFEVLHVVELAFYQPPRATGRQNFSDSDIFWKVVIHLVFIASAVFLALLDRITSQTHTKPAAQKDGH